MEITKQPTAGGLEFRLSGRLDSTWADTLRSKLDESVREGIRQISLHMANVPYMSSAGIRVLLTVHKQLHAIEGSLSVAEPSEQVRTILSMAGLQMLMRRPETPAAARAEQPGAMRITSGPVTLEVYRHASSGPAVCKFIGDPARLAAGGWRKSDVAAMSLSRGEFALGVGAFGNTAEETWDRFGELVAVAGAAACMPTDGANTPDYLVSSGAALCGMQMLYAMTCETRLPYMARFETDPQGNAATLTVLVRAALDVADCDLAGMVIVAETTGLIGAALRTSPALQPAGGTPFDHPGIRRWISFTCERAHARRLALTAGIAGRKECAPLASFLRPLGAEPWPVGHVHAAVLPFLPLAKGDIPLAETVAHLFDSGAPEGVLHLLRDGREMGGGESEFRRGAMWFGPAAVEPEPPRHGEEGRAP